MADWWVLAPVGRLVLCCDENLLMLGGSECTLGHLSIRYTHSLSLLDSNV